MTLDREIQNSNRATENYFELPVNPDVIFSNHKGVHKKRIEKRQASFIERIQFVRPFLWQDEEILLVTTGCSTMSFMEQIMTGWIIYSLKRSYFIFTNKRIFHVPLRVKSFGLANAYEYRNSIAQILYADCEFIKHSGRTLTIKYKSGKKERFYHIGGKEKKKIKQLVKTMSFTGEPSKMLQRTHLCPRCTELLIEGEYTCPACSLVFKSRKKVRKISLVWPGGGYFYTRHYFLGALDALTEFLLMIGLSGSIMDVLDGTERGLEDTILFAIVLFIEKITTIYHSNHFVKEFIPEDKHVVPYTEPVDYAADSQENTNDEQNG